MTSTTLRLSDGRAAAILEEGQGDVLLLIHGVGLQKAAWAAQIAALSPRMRVVAVDMPGHGGSDPLPEGSLLPDFVAWAARVIEALDCGPVSLAGHSMGALIAAGTAIERPDLVTRLAVLNGVFRRSEAARAAVIARADEMAQGEKDIDGPIARWFDASPADQAHAALARGWLTQVDPAAYATVYGAFARGDATYADRWAQLSCPVLVLTADGDPNSTPAMARAMAEAAPRAELKIIEGHRHMVPMTAPDEVSAAILCWHGLDLVTR
ncbi:alpha/beta hydrolase [Pseudooceanicola sp. CBS1P-1]|uniref:Alpha/beta fold hydrolase n=1 Tax=Pseudooceanicola albus TaxID=2692189 RepID=A0A6L7G0C1_9RHOB|nr:MULTISPECIES: alpha/beta hydrolase [Pseudooceanicola]MBT9383671.1 alpha/beta hydrolase [Pseudooceanicola endophyticus]MXN17525.1 alpha/beta fold hydrolase [Pseudooceanicola albus]